MMKLLVSLALITAVHACGPAASLAAAGAGAGEGAPCHDRIADERHDRNRSLPPLPPSPPPPPPPPPPPAAATVPVVVHADVLLHARSSATSVGVGIEDVNHELIGGLYASLLFGESFEEPPGFDGVSGSGGLTWRALAEPGCAYETVARDAWTGLQSQALRGAAGCGLRNGGLAAAGFAVEAGREYAGYVFAKVNSSAAGPAAVALSAALLDTTTNATLAAQLFSVPADGAWRMLNFSLTPAASTACVLNSARPTRAAGRAAPQSCCTCAANAEGLCPACAGAFALSLPSGSAGLALQLDHAFLAPAAWGTLPSAGWRTTRLDAALALTTPAGAGRAFAGDGGGLGLNLNTLRLGGGMVLVGQYAWKAFRGAPWLRQPYRASWYSPSSRGWGIFEFLNLCEAQAVRSCVVNLNAAELPSDVADFAEYAFAPSGDNATFPWAELRAADGHPAPYAPFGIEVGNEQSHADPGFVRQVAAVALAINSSLARLGAPAGFLPVIVGAAAGLGYPPASAAGMALALRGLANPETSRVRLLWDVHVGGDSPARDGTAAAAFVDALAAWFEAFAANVSNATAPAAPIRVAVLEENGVRHDVVRMLGRATLQNRLACLGERVELVCAANGMQVFGRNYNGWDQGQLFLSANASWASPHGVAAFMLGELARRGLGAVLAVEAAPAPAGQPALDVVALADADGATVGLSIVNTGTENVTALVQLRGCALAGGAGGALANVTTAFGVDGEQNDPAETDRVRPLRSAIALDAARNNSAALPLMPRSFTTLVARCAVAADARAPGAHAGARARAAALVELNTTCGMH